MMTSIGSVCGSIVLISLTIFLIMSVYALLYVVLLGMIDERDAHRNRKRKRNREELEV